ncbi:MAG: hypothetical protein CM15mP69_6970 [Ectothiorhodospiraceae bacterium]|nr:MAG: hypothetical protein CM15mP69_6970 [Ectothiorhodospiraceae bacterium]
MLGISNGIEFKSKVTKRAMPKKKSDSKFGTLAHEWIETRKSRVTRRHGIRIGLG